MEPLVDSYGRRIKSMRISITDKCNFRCTYCMPAEGLPWLKKAEILSYEEIVRISRVAVNMGIEQIRLTGGEPLVRRDVPDLIRQLHTLEGLRSLSLTTNGVLLKQQAQALAEAGLTRINVSLDSLVREKFAQLTRRDQIERVLEGLEEIKKYPSIHPIKINAVAMRDFTEEEVLDFVRFARDNAFVVRWIEFMPLDADQIWRKEDILTGAEIKAIIEAAYGPLVQIKGDPSETARRYTFSDGVGEIGFINPVSEPFCSSCDRIRLTADGQLRTCLFATEETDLRSVVRSDASDAQLADVIRQAVWHKELKHYIGDKRFKRASRTMSRIGG
ncbi:cyclic pyranopterin phosphate synthase [Thermosporothrix hazakensis]|jgi:cyclic pyranopterin phosphate synthase|uniref:GTP 3',8-cyclase n=2 Tax=Thermosporothrix TaxID=768650 RepID=A0A326UAB9_THEHA|nr:GTP 3',8-cyclase MoaA [Thermosporothrix hazakensis]PZW32084.1 cyclic pyranopterin phosphate synthase [Thermosporothrix hazakensis]BBH91443.1 cyclic pyranopterin monophosphate synthase [Thermosporothrix sp. COM3]GCE49588.1 cyclic pyranopterin monophosphate synthase [Thermosporothrix hazakensis]